ncbi:MAG: KH domain-containing protein [bacterium]
MASLVELIAKKLVDHPDSVAVTEVSGDYSCVVELRVAKADIGKVIGKKGAHAQAIRTLMMAASGKDGRRYILEILDE